MNAEARRGLARRLREVTFPRALAGAGLSGAVLLAAGAVLPLGPPPKVRLITGYGFFDNRRLLLEYGLLLLAVAVGPFVALLLQGRGKKEAKSAGSSVAPAVRRPAPAWRRVALLAGLAGLLLLFFVGPGVAYRGINGHEMVHFGYLSEIVHGKVLNVDTRICYGPLLGYSMYWFMKLVSFDLYGFRLYWNVLTAVFLFLLIWAVMKRMRHRYLLGLLVLHLVLYTTARYYMPDPRGINGGFWGWGNVARQGWVPLAVLALAGPLARGRSGWPFLAGGALVVVGAFYAQETLAPGVAALGSCGLVCGLRRQDRSWLRAVLWSLSGAAAAWLAVMAPVLMRGGLDYFLRASNEVPRLFLSGFGNRPYPPLFGDTAGAAAGNVVYYLLPAGIVLALLAWWVRALRGDPGSGVEFPLALYAALSYVNVLVRADPPHIFNVMVAPLLLVFLAADRWSEGRGSAGEARAGGLLDRSAVRRWAPVVILAAPLLVFRPGVIDVARGLAGRVLHFDPAPPPGLARLPADRARIWTSPANWFDDAKWGAADDPAAVEMMRGLAGGRPVLIAGGKSSLYYFLTGLPSAVPFTDLSSQCFTYESFKELGDRFVTARPDFVFAPEDSPNLGPPPGTRYRRLGKAHGFLVYQNEDRPPVALPPAGEGGP